ncbi:MAG: ATP-dependent helicase HrpB [Myxococcaceae bacterium]|nr:ATP-dependent helicase HrpB [Myxococcaceae bacterium]
MLTLPIDSFLPGIIASLEREPNLVLVAEPGAGKTTRLPAALLGASFAKRGQVLVLEPRRLAARMAARRIASELGEPVGERVGYIVRFEREVSERTRVVFLTEALLTRRFLEPAGLRDVSCVVLDEFHERSLHTDLGLALLRRLQQTERPDLRIVVMSATLDAEKVAEFLGAPIVRVPGRTHPVEVSYLDKPDERRLEDQVAAAVRKLCVRKLDGDVLVFLPGAAEIRRAEQSCTELSRSFDFELALLHGDLPAAQQDRAVSRGPRNKVVLSTNIAETSLTLEGVVAVIDSGLARVAGHSPWSGLSTLSTQKVSQASSVQRAGRAGRVRPGECLRLYTRSDFDTRARYDVPELAKSDLCSVELTLRSMFAGAPELAWLEAPPQAARSHAIELLLRLGAITTPDSALTRLGRDLLALPVHPRLARLAYAVAERGYLDEGALLAALLSERDVRLTQRAQLGGGRRGQGRDEVGESDLVARLDAIEAVSGDLSADKLRRYELDAGAVRAVLRTRDQLARGLRRVPRPAQAAPFEEAVAIATLLSYPDRVGKRRNKHGSDIVLAAGGSAALSDGSIVKEAELLVAVEADERGRSGAVVHTASAIEPEWLLEYFPERVRSERTLSFHTGTSRVEVSDLVMYDALLLDESRRVASPGPEVARVLADAALARGPNAPWDVAAVEHLQRRLNFVSAYVPDVPALDEARLRETLIAHCADKVSFEDLRGDPFEHALLQQLEGGLRARLDQLAPTRVKLPGSRELQVHYELDRPPWIESRLQDFFGSLDGPRIANGQVPLVLQLLAPNQRPVQVTTDLKGFWERHYPAIRKELMRRYPRHSWPDDPRSAPPPPPRPPRPPRR